MSERSLSSSALPSVSDGHGPDGRAGEETRARMSGRERREQLLVVGREVFAEKGYEAASIEEIAERAKVSKPIVYEHFGGKQGMYAVLVDREVQRLLDGIMGALRDDHPRVMLEQAAMAFLTYIEAEPEGFRILVRDAPPMLSTSGTLASVLGDIAERVEQILNAEFRKRGYKTKTAGLYSRALVGMVASVGEWWLHTGKPKKADVAAHLVNLAWNGLSHLEAHPPK
jgi:AcrR family transcriptional regulator